MSEVNRTPSLHPRYVPDQNSRGKRLSTKNDLRIVNRHTASSALSAERWEVFSCQAALRVFRHLAELLSVSAVPVA